MQRRTTKLDQGFSGRTLTAVGVRSSSVDSSHPKHGGKINATHALYFLLCIILVCIVFLIGIILWTLKTSASNRKTTTGSGSSSSTIKWCKESSSIVRNVNITSSIATEITNYNSTASSNNATTDTTTDANKISTSTTVSAETLQVTKRNGTLQKLQQEKLQRRLDRLMRGLDQRYVHTHVLCHKIVRGLYPLISTTELDVLASETSATMSTRHPDYARLAARICISNNHKRTSNSFTKSMMKLDTTKAKDEGNNDGNFLSPQILQLLQKRGKEIDDYIQHDRDYHLSYFGYKTLEKSYLLKDRYTQEVIERPQYMFMRVALGIHCSANINTTNNAIEEDDDNTTTALLLKALETYDHLSQGYFMHASPTLFHSGTS